MRQSFGEWIGKLDNPKTRAAQRRIEAENNLACIGRRAVSDRRENFARRFAGETFFNLLKLAQ